MSIESKFLDFHINNPIVYKYLCIYAREAKKAGFNHYSINGIFERMRWHLNIQIKSKDKFKLSNNHRSRYARLIMENEPDLKDFFIIRELRSS